MTIKDEKGSTRGQNVTTSPQSDRRTPPDSIRRSERKVGFVFWNAGGGGEDQGHERERRPGSEDEQPGQNVRKEAPFDRRPGEEQKTSRRRPESPDYRGLDAEAVHGPRGESLGDRPERDRRRQVGEPGGEGVVAEDPPEVQGGKEEPPDHPHHGERRHASSLWSSRWMAQDRPSGSPISSNREWALPRLFPPPTPFYPMFPTSGAGGTRTQRAPARAPRRRRRRGKPAPAVALDLRTTHGPSSPGSWLARFTQTASRASSSKSSSWMPRWRVSLLLDSPMSV